MVAVRNDVKALEGELAYIKKVSRKRNLNRVYQQPQTTDCESGTEQSLQMTFNNHLCSDTDIDQPT